MIRSGLKTFFRIGHHRCMSSRTLLAQDDFSSLGIADAGNDEYSKMLDDEYHCFTSIECAASESSRVGDSRRSIAQFNEGEMYHPVNFNQDQLCELIRNWQLSLSKQQDVDPMDIELFSDTCDCVLEPVQPILESAPPPKRFYSIFWRSLTRRVVQHEQERSLNRGAAGRT
jgi:hypothetical protein